MFALRHSRLSLVHADPLRRRLHKAGWKVNPVELAESIKVWLPANTTLRPRMAAQIGDAMSGGEQDITVTALRPGSYHRSEGARALRKNVRTLFFIHILSSGRRSTPVPR